jgi:hypothetical protein
MLKKISILVFGVMLVFILKTTLAGIKSSGAPAAATGAPLELTCAQSGCHTGADINSGTANLQIDFNNQVNEFIEANTYPITVSITDAGHSVFGFELVALDENGNNAGTFKITDANRTQVIKGFGSLSNRSYATYKVNGTAAISSGYNKWQVEWQATSGIEGNVTFYLAALSADGDNTDAGDFTFTKSIIIENKSAAGVATQNNLNNEMNIYPNPVTDYLRFTIFDLRIKNIEILTLKGQKLLNYSIDQNLNEKKLIDVSTLKTGIYFLKISNDEKSVIKKFVKN